MLNTNPSQTGQFQRSFLIEASEVSVPAQAKPSLSNSPDPQPLHEREYQPTGFSLSKCPEVVRSRPDLETGAKVPGRKRIG
jgi:hypothetical protein